MIERAADPDPAESADGRVASVGSTRTRILDAARVAFAAEGFRGATLRGIAAEAKVDVALIAHYFGNKQGLYAATIDLPPEAFDVVVSGLSGPRETQGERLTRGYIGLWENAASAAAMRVMVQGAFSNEAIGDRLHALLLGVRDDAEFTRLVAGRETGVLVALTHLMGVGMARYVIQVPMVRDIPLEELVARVSWAVQMHLDG